MLFDYYTFKQELLEQTEKKAHVEKYISLFGDSLNLNKEPFYMEYMSNFKPIAYQVPESLKDDFDSELLLQLVVASFSSEYKFIASETEADIPELLIKVESGEQEISKKVSELMSFQIKRLFEIYCEEMMNLACLRLEDDLEKDSIDWERDERMFKYENKVKQFDFELKYNEQSKVLIGKLQLLVGSSVLVNK